MLHTHITVTKLPHKQCFTSIPRSRMVVLVQLFCDSLCVLLFCVDPQTALPTALLKPQRQTTTVLYMWIMSNSSWASNGLPWSLSAGPNADIAARPGKGNAYSTVHMTVTWPAVGLCVSHQYTLRCCLISTGTTCACFCYWKLQLVNKLLLWERYVWLTFLCSQQHKWLSFDWAHLVVNHYVRYTCSIAT